jgi:hypothetical protein
MIHLIGFPLNGGNSLSEKIKHIFIVVICMMAAWLGPILLINARNNFYYLLGGLFFSLLFLCLYLVILGIENLLQRLLKNPKLVFIFGNVLGASPLFYLLLSGYIYLDTFFQPYVGIALLNLSIIFLLIILVLVYNFFKYRYIWRALYETSLFYLLPVAFLFIGFYFLETSELEVIFGNIGLVYFFLINLFVRTRIKM